MVTKNETILLLPPPSMCFFSKTCTNLPQNSSVAEEQMKSAEQIACDVMERSCAASLSIALTRQSVCICIPQLKRKYSPAATQRIHLLHPASAFTTPLSHAAQPHGHCAHALHRQHIPSHRRHSLLDGNGASSATLFHVSTSHLHTGW